MSVAPDATGRIVAVGVSRRRRRGRRHGDRRAASRRSSRRAGRTSPSPRSASRPTGGGWPAARRAGASSSGTPRHGTSHRTWVAVQGGGVDSLTFTPGLARRRGRWRGDRLRLGASTPVPQTGMTLRPERAALPVRRRRGDPRRGSDRRDAHRRQGRAALGLLPAGSPRASLRPRRPQPDPGASGAPRCPTSRTRRRAQDDEDPATLESAAECGVLRNEKVKHRPLGATMGAKRALTPLDTRRFRTGRGRDVAAP